ncbi:cytochrome c biogenesis protein CcsA [Algihabitans albus]|uniref:cytochrome c biogenesis protein CcsA n=1 Tax=Algihabitans albus TaxID=2164067 RepID=UPI000E5D405F|nr:cytochrome c biogenesis protein CcsA [Algihabitans albus]
MPIAFLINLTALAALLPAALLPWRWRNDRPDMVFWAVLAVAVAGPVAAISVQLGGGWSTGFGAALWLSVAVSLAAFTASAALLRQAWRLAALLLPYLLCLGLLGTIWIAAETGPEPASLPTESEADVWLLLHIAVSLTTYALATLAAVAAAAVFLQERSLKRKRRSSLTERLPSVADAERLQFHFLAAAETVLGLGILTGVGLAWVQAQALPLDHKTLLSLLAFAVIGLLLYLQSRTGLRGKRAGRLVLVAYLLLTLAYPGVKFVTDMLIV